MEYEFTFGEKQYSVNIEKVNTEKSFGIKASINGQPINADVSPISANCYLLQADNRNLRIYAVSTSDDVFVSINGQALRLGKVTGDQHKFSREGLEYGAKDKVVSPMPGKVVKILVTEGEKVTRKQPLVIVESMKMENEIKSPANGTIKAILFKAGDLVEASQAIITIDPE